MTTHLRSLKRFWPALAIPLVLIVASPGWGRTIILCNSNEHWPPYSFIRGDALAGEYREILDAAFADLGLSYEQVAHPWKRCQERAEAGELDGLIGAAYAPERGALFHFPADAMEVMPMDALSQVEAVVVTRADGPMPDAIRTDALPEPIGMLLGYQAADKLQHAGKRVQLATKQESLIHMLERGRIASAVLLRGAAEHFVKQSEEALMIHEPALWSTPHFLAFSRNGTVDAETMQKIWAAIARVRSNPARMAQIRAKVTAMLEP